MDSSKLANRLLSVLLNLITLALTNDLTALPSAVAFTPPPLSAPVLGNFFDIRVDNLNQDNGAIAYNSLRQEFFTIWREPGAYGHWEIFGRRIGVDGSLHGNAIRLIGDSNYDCQSPAVSYSPLQDKYLLVYRIGPPSDWDVRSVLISWDGASLTYGIIDTNSQRHPSFLDVTYNSLYDEFLVVYDDVNFTSGNSEILAQRRKASDGSQVGATVGITGFLGVIHWGPKVAYNKNRNEYVFAYSYLVDAQPATFTKAVFKRVNADLSLVLTDETDLITNAYAYDIALAAGPDEVLAVWGAKNGPGDSQTKILGRRIRGDGTLGSVITVADQAPNGCNSPGVAYDSVGSYLISWNFINVSRSNIADVYGRLLPAGRDTPAGGEFPLSYVSYSEGGFFIPDGNQTNAQAACAASGVCLVALADSGGFLNPDNEIRGRLVTPNIHRTYFTYLPQVHYNWEQEGTDSATLIDQAVSVGVLDPETGLVYKVYAAFGDSRLPPQYHGEDPVVLDSLVLAEVRSRWATLSPQARALLNPFLIPPTQAGSYEQLGLSRDGGGPLGDYISWRTVDSASGVRVWYQTRFINDDLLAQGLARAIDDRIYPKLMAAMNNRKWLDDGGQGNVNGGDGRLDVYLVSKLDHPGVTTPNVGYKNTPVFINLRHDFILGDDTHFGLVHILAHEMMHAVQFSYNWKEDFDNYIWLAEATANWFLDFAYPLVNVEHRAARRFLNSASLSLDDLTYMRHYGSYLLPSYLTHFYGTVGFIASMWQNTEAFDSLSAVDLAIPGGFEAAWPEFVRYNWNRDPQKEEYLWDKLPYGAFSVTDAVPLGALPLPVELKHLSAQYYRLTFSDDNLRSVIFYNGLTFKLAEGEVPSQWPNTKKYYPQALSPEEMKGVGIHALIKIAGQNWKWEDWSYLPSKGYCRDARAERLEELVLIFSNSELDPDSPNYLLKPRGLNPLLLTSDLGCWQWKGTVNRTQNMYPGVNQTWATNVTFERQAPGLSEDQIYQVKEGSTQWGIHGQWAIPGWGSMGYEGSTNVTLKPQDATLITYNSHTGGSLYRALFGMGTCDGTLPYTISFPDGTVMPQEMPGCIWLETNTGTDLPPKVTSGTVADGTYVYEPGNAGLFITDQWHLEAQREP